MKGQKKRKSLAKIILFSLFLSGYVSVSQAQDQERWRQDLIKYKERIEQLPDMGVRTNRAVYAGVAAGACSTSTLLVVSQFVADSMPLFVNVLGEAMPNLLDSSYRSMAIDDAGTISGVAATLIRSLMGGAGMSIYESGEFLFYLLAGETDKIYQGTAKMYESTIITAKALFSDKALCSMSVARYLIATSELSRRYPADLTEDKSLVQMSDIIMP